MSNRSQPEPRESSKDQPIFASVELARWVVRRIPRDTRSVLDLACGKAIIPYIIRSNFTRIERMVGIEIYEPYIDFVKERKIFDAVIRWDLTKLPLPIGNKEFDVAFCVEAIEHVDKAAASALISEMERVASLVILTTPNVWNENQDSALDGNKAQLHRSIWSPEDFRRRGYEVRGIGDFKWGPTALKFALGPLTYPFPELGTNLLAIKHSNSSP